VHARGRKVESPHQSAACILLPGFLASFIRQVQRFLPETWLVRLFTILTPEFESPGGSRLEPMSRLHCSTKSLKRSVSTFRVKA
jgi:hypothetical protein